MTDTKINSKWIKDPNVRPETVKLQQEKIWESLHDFGYSNDFLNMTPTEQVTTAEIHKMGFVNNSTKDPK